jgi:formimidoylglutamate deiminase
MTDIFARQALTADGWARNVRIETAGGYIASITSDVDAKSGDVLAGIVIPGLANAHSHAFQRVLAGHTEHRSPAHKDNFWSWRSRMYALAGKIDAESLHVIARQVYSEMVATGYTSVAEFHYLHNEPGDSRPSAAMFEAIAAAARDSGIRLTYVPVLYERAGLDEPLPTADQERFALGIDDFIDHYESASEQTGGAFQTGIGAHSLRAVSADSLARIAAVAKRDRVPMHIHIAEQQREVDQCLNILGARPVEWLMEHCDVDGSWCLVHATHIDESELSLIAKSGAVVCLCPSTEANLGDGLFPLQAFMEAGGYIAIGSDSHVSINPFEELRWLEYGQRLIGQRRNVAAIRRSQTGRSLFESAVTGGAAACGHRNGELATGANADLVVLDDDSPMLAGHTTRSLLDALVFSGFTLPIDRVMVNGEWKVAEGRHENSEMTGAAYAKVARALKLDEVAV